MDWDMLLEMAMAVKGKTDPQELEFLYRLATDAPKGPAAEVGVLWGRSLIVILEARHGRGPVYAVDDELRHGMLDNVGPGPEWVRGLSWEAHRQVPDGLAFCFIDADHGLEAFPKDILPWTAKIARTGIIAFHDYNDLPEFAVKAYVNWWQSMVHWEDLGCVVQTQAYRRPK